MSSPIPNSPLPSPQARLSPVSPLTGKVHCLACGKAFDLYSVLAQHVGDKHEGMNSPEANFRAVPAPAARPAPAPAALPSGKRAQVTLGGFLPLLKAPKTGKKPLAAPVTIARSTPAPSKTLQPALRPSAAPAAPPPSTSAAAPAAATATSLRLERTQVYKGRQRAQPRKKKPSKMRRSVLALRKEQRAEQARDRDEAVVRLAAELPPLAAVVRGLQRVEGAQRERVAELQGILTELRARAASLRPAAPPPHEEPSTSATPAPGPVLMSRWADIVLGGKGERASAPSVHVVSVKVHRKANIAASRTALRKRRRAALATCQETTPEASELAALALQVQLTKMKLRVESFKLQHCIAMVAGVRDRARGLFAMLRRAGTRTRKLVRSDLTGVTNADWAALMGRKFRVGMKKEEAGAGDESDTDPSPPPLTDLRAEEAGSRLLDAAAARLTDPTLWTSDDPSSSALRCAACPGAAFASLDLLHAHLASPEHAARAAAVLRSQAATSTPTAAPGLPKSNLKRPPPPRLLPQGALDALLPPPPPPPQIPPDDTHGAMSGGPGDEEEDREEDDMDGDGDDAAGDSSPAVAPEILEASAAGTLERIRPPAEVWGTERPLKKLLHELMRFQRRLVETNPTKAKMRRRFYSGLRECHKWTRIGKVRLLVLARDIEQAPGVGGTLEALHALLRDAGQRGVPVLWCATRERLGFIFGGK